jgi:hypothetical protein
MSRPKVSASLVSLVLAAAIHTDWHFARPEHHRLSLGLPWHWLLAIPVFALAAWYVARVWPTQVLQASIAILAGGIVMGAVLEPAFEYFLGGATREWAFGAERNMAAATFVGTGLLAYLATLAVIRRSSEPLDAETT